MNEKKALEKGDIIVLGFHRYEIEKIIYSEPWAWRNAYYVEFMDTAGIYRNWKQNQDGGSVIYHK